MLALAYPEHAATVTLDAPTAGEPLGLIDAAVQAFQRDTGLPVPALAPQWHTTIPRQVGLSGSSALILATLRALSRWAGGTLEGLALAQATWHVETHDLGTPAGPQDRVIQALQGLMDMDFGTAPWTLSAINPSCTPPLLLGWPRDTGAPSGRVHGALAGGGRPATAQRTPPWPGARSSPPRGPRGSGGGTSTCGSWSTRTWPSGCA